MIRYQSVWPASLRGLHWLQAALLCVLFASAWILNHSIEDPAFWHDWHSISGQVILVAAVARIALWFQKGVGHWRKLWPEARTRSARKQMWRFYLSLGRSPLPNWYAHNPWWQPLYLALPLLTVICAISGMMFDANQLWLGWLPSDWHRVSTTVLGWVILAHIITAIAHDWKGHGANISGMINGYRYFHIGQGQLEVESPQPIEITLDSLSNHKPSNRARKGN